MKQLEKIASKHNKWKHYVRSFGCNPCYVEDVIQDMYLKVHRLIEGGSRIVYGDDDCNDFYVYMTLKSVYTDYLRKKGSLYKDATEKEKLEYFLNKLEAEENNEDELQAFERLMSRVREEINNLDDGTIDGWYAKNLFIEKQGMSFTALKEETGIGRSSIVTTVNNCKDKLRNALIEDYLDYKNKDYDLL